MKVIKSLIRMKFNIASKICGKLDAAIAKNDVRAKKSWSGLRQGSLTQRAKSFFLFGYSWKMAAAERLVKVPFAVSRKLNGHFVK
jgi:hypothetical protein